ncbi:unnamed protein product, partial [Onchocerca ochengi]|uniref:Anaphase-promoting complex subunit 1 n=1 Tax=Onchocerca ochengi TaxID=42157 RepID=A0A182EJA4_ONCOC
ECNTTRPPCEASTLQFLRLAIRWGFPKLDVSTIARIVPVFPDTYSSHLNVDEQPHIINEMIQTQHDYELYKESDGLADSTVPQLSPLGRIELLKIKCKQVFKWTGQGFMSDISKPTLAPSMLTKRNVFELPPMQRPSRIYDTTEKIDWKKKAYIY